MQIHPKDVGSEIKLTGEEFIKILEFYFERKISGFVILNPDPSPMGKIVRQAITHPLDKENFVGNIKSLRETIKSVGKYLMLSEARWAIDNWDQWLQFVDRHNRLPGVGYGSGEDKGKLR